jgi:hypothetical protein
MRINVGTLFEGVVLRVLEDHVQFRMLGGGGPDVLVHLHAPRLAQIALGHADGVTAGGVGLGGIGIGTVAACQKPGQKGEANGKNLNGLLVHFFAYLCLFMPFHAFSCLFAVPPLRHDRRDNNDARQNQAPRFGHGVNAENLIQIANCQHPQQSQTHPAPSPHQAGAADDHHGDGD